MGLSRRRRYPELLPLFTRRARPGILLIALRWRIELTALFIVTGALVAAAGAFGTGAVLLALACVATVASFAVAWPPTRQLIESAAWPVITPHRVRSCFAQLWVYNSSGKIPAVIRAVATPTGERVLVLCRAGISVEDIAAISEALAAACWAARVVVTRSDRYAQLVYIDVIRRPAGGLETGSGPPEDEPDPWLPTWPFDPPGQDELGPGGSQDT